MKKICVFVLLWLLPSMLNAADVALPGIDISFGGPSGEPQDFAAAIKILFGLTILSLAPSILIMMTSFTRIIIVLSMLRHALGMQQTPPNTVLISLALFLTFFSMSFVFKEINEQAYQPYLDKSISAEVALQNGMEPLKAFMIKQTREKDLALMLEISGTEPPDRVEDIDVFMLIPAFILSELKTAFQLGFVIFLPFLLIDIVIASILMSLGMLMVPPMMISLPIKVLMFVLIDGWNLVVESLMGSFV